MSQWPRSLGRAGEGGGEAGGWWGQGVLEQRVACVWANQSGLITGVTDRCELQGPDTNSRPILLDGSEATCLHMPC